jgi:hypothetical protein
MASAMVTPMQTTSVELLNSKFSRAIKTLSLGPHDIQWIADL